MSVVRNLTKLQPLRPDANLPGRIRMHMQTLPYDVQEDIVAFLPQCTLHALALTSKYFADLCARALYTSVQFIPTPATLCHALQLGQIAFIKTLTSHPEYALFIRRIDWFVTGDLELPVETVWACFAELTAVTNLTLRLNVADKAPPPTKPLFPNLQEASLGGLYPEGALDMVLHSPYITRLRFEGLVAEFHGKPSWTTRLSPFLLRAVNKSLFPRLKHLELKVYNRYYEHISPCALENWLTYLSPTLESLLLQLQSTTPRDAWGLLVLRQLFDETGDRGEDSRRARDAKWGELTAMEIRGAVVPEEVEKALTKKCPKMSDLRIVVDYSSFS